MNRYRIVTNGDEYKIQKRYLHFFWFDCCDYVGGGIYIMAVNHNKFIFVNKQNAIDKMNRMEDKHNTPLKKWVPLDIESDLYKNKIINCSKNYELNTCAIAKNEHIKCEECVNERSQLKE